MKLKLGLTYGRLLTCYTAQTKARTQDNRSALNICYSIVGAGIQLGFAPGDCWEVLGAAILGVGEITDTVPCYYPNSQ